MARMFRRSRPVAAVPDMAFPSPSGDAPVAARMPWRLPPEPAQTGIAADAVTVGGLTVRAASVVGPGHRCQEPAEHRQDAYRLGRTGRFLLVAVADGMSDSSRSHLGAGVAVAALVGRMRAELEKGMGLNAEEVFLDAARQMSGMAEQQGVTENDVRTAALAAVIPVEPDPSGGRDIWLAWLADAGAWMRADTGWRHLGGEKKEGLDAGRLSEFLPFHPDRTHSTTVRVEKGAVLALATDGVGDAFTGRTGGWFAERWAEPPHVMSFVAEVGYEAKGQLDDRTAVVVWCDR
jgi:serine/threonine protein phosphatase PrpC